MIYILISVIIIILSFVFWKVQKKINYWKNIGIDYEPAVPIFGNLLRPSFLSEHVIYTFQRIYKKHSDKPFVGIHFYNEPSLFIMDPELIKMITVKNFDHFSDHGVSFLYEDLDPLFAKNLVNLTGKRWHEMRSTLSPAFTGSKMKFMFQLISECGEQMSNYFKKEFENNKMQPIVDVDMRNILARFTTDAVATIAFGIKVDSLKEKNNEFFEMGKECAQLKSWKFLLASTAPWILKIFNTGIIPKHIYKYIEDLIYENIKIREREGIVRPDILHLLLQSRKGNLENEEIVKETGLDKIYGVDSSYYKSTKKIELTDEDIASQAFIFFQAGYESVSTSICFIAQELAMHLDIQKRLTKEIDDLKLKYGDEFTYETLARLKYMDAVIAESHRKWPQTGFLIRECTKPYLLKAGKQEIQLEKGFKITIPVHALHHDSKYFTDPEKFDPDRFSDGNKESITPYTYLPFGLGPRFCIGQRLALLETKIALYHLLNNFELFVSNKTQIPLELNPQKFVSVSVKKGFFLGIKLRKNM